MKPWKKPTPSAGGFSSPIGSWLILKPQNSCLPLPHSLKPQRSCSCGKGRAPSGPRIQVQITLILCPELLHACLPGARAASRDSPAGWGTEGQTAAMQYDMRPNRDKPTALRRLENLIQPECGGKGCPELVAGDSRIRHRVESA